MSSHTMGARIALCPFSMVLLKRFTYPQSLHRREDNQSAKEERGERTGN